MNQEIKYQGFSTSPSDYECVDGDMAAAINLVPEDGTLKPLSAPKQIRHLSPGDSVFIHKTTDGDHYIICASNGKGSWIHADKADTDTPKDIFNYGPVTHLNAVGNTLIVFTPKGMVYLLWKKENDSEGYITLGQQLPDVQLSFRLSGRPLLYSMDSDDKKTFTVKFDAISPSNIFNTWSDANQKNITSQVMAKVNKFLADQSIHKGRFALPFFVRYALRLYDGSLVRHSAPILMNPCTTTSPVVLWNYVKGNDNYSQAECDIMMVSTSLSYFIHNLGELRQWKDIVKSVDIFISKPIYTYDQNGKCTSFRDNNNLNTRFIGMLAPDGVTSGSTKSNHLLLPITLITPNKEEIIDKDNFVNLALNSVEWSFADLYAMYYSKNRSFPSVSIHLPEFSDEEKGAQVKDAYNFYYLHSLSTEELLAELHDWEIPVAKDYLQSLVTRELMTDDYLTHDRLIPEMSHTYNSRLNLAGVSRYLYAGFSPSSMFASVTSDSPGFNSVRTPSGEWELQVKFPANNFAHSIEVYVLIREAGKTYRVETSTSSLGSKPLAHYLSVKRYPSQEDANQGINAYYLKNSWGSYVFYPNVNAYKMIIHDDKGSFAIPLKPHDFLNGAYAFLGYDKERRPNTSIPVNNDSDRVFMPNKLFVSEVNNPFFFPLQGICTVGAGRILGLSSAAKALSQGQFGQFPLYAFTDEGVWAMELSSSGLYSARQPITRDVCINPDGITQIDSAVLFPTDRGIMLLSGSNAQCISDIISTEHPFDAMSLPHMDKLAARFQSQLKLKSCLHLLPFTDFLRDCRMLYDYVHQRIIVYNTSLDVAYAYVFSLKSQKWGMMYNNIVSGVNSYPNCLAVDGNGMLMDFASVQDKSAPVHCFALSRPIKLGMHDVHKTIRSVVQRGFFAHGNVQSVLYGSNNLHNWFPLWSSKDHFLRGFSGTPYKYFRVALLCCLPPNESLFGASIEFYPHLTNQPR